MHTRGFKLFAITSMLALLTGGQLCMLVQCSPKRAANTVHACCAAKAAAAGATSAKSAKSERPAPGPGASSRPCCMQVTMASAPQLDAPATAPGHVQAALLVALELAASPVRAGALHAPADLGPPPLLAVPGTRGLRAPPVSA